MINGSKAFLEWLKRHDAYIDEPISYWNSNVTSTILFNYEKIQMKELCSNFGGYISVYKQHRKRFSFATRCLYFIFRS